MDGRSEQSKQSQKPSAESVTTDLEPNHTLWEWLDPRSEHAEKLVIDNLLKADVPLEVGQVDSLQSYLGNELFENAQTEPLEKRCPELAQVIEAKKYAELVIGGRRVWVVEAEIEGIPIFVEFWETDQTSRSIYSSTIKKEHPAFSVTRLVAQTKSGHTDLIRRLPKSVIVRAVVMDKPEDREFYFSPSSKEVVISTLKTADDLSGFVHEVGHAQFHHVADPEIEDEISDALVLKKTFLSDHLMGRRLPDVASGKDGLNVKSLIEASWLVAQSEHFASAWGLAELGKLFDLSPEKIAEVKEQYESNFESYDQVPLTQGSTSEAAAAIPYEHKEAVVEHIKWFQNVIENLQLLGVSLNRELEFQNTQGPEKMLIRWKEGLLSILYFDGEDAIVTGVISFSSSYISVKVKDEETTFRATLYDADHVGQSAEVLLDPNYKDLRETLDTAFHSLLIEREEAGLKKISRLLELAESLGISATDIDPKKTYERLLHLPLLERVLWASMGASDTDNQVSIEANNPLIRLSRIIYKLGVVLAQKYNAEDTLFAHFNPITGDAVITDTDRLVAIIDVLSEDAGLQQETVRSLIALKELVKS